MKAYLFVRPFCVASILILALFLGGCSATRYLSENQKLVKKVTINGIDKRFDEQANLYIQRDIMPNSKLNLWLYNRLNTKNGKYRTDRIRDIGEAPNLLDSSLMEISRREIEKFLFDKSFFRARVKSDVEIKGKKAYITFTADPGPSFRIRELAYVIPDTAVKELYLENRPSFTSLNEQSRYDGDSLRNESKQIFNLLQRNGYYDYKEQYVRFTVDTNLYSSEANVKLFLDNPEQSPKHKVYFLRNTSMLIKSSNGKTEPIIPDSAVLDSQYFMKDYSHRFKPRAIFRYNYLRKGERYDIDKKNLTYDRLFDLNVFKSVKIDYVKTDDSTGLDALIETVPMKRLSNRIEGEYTFNSGRNGFNIGNTYTNRNVFGGAEQLDFRIKYGLLFNSAIKGNLVDRIFNRDVQFGVNLTFPRLLVPFYTSKLGKNGIPKTIISSSLQIFDQVDAFKSRLIINSLTYDWVESRTKTHSFTPINIEYRKGVLTNTFRDSLENAGYYLYIRTNDRQYFNLGSLYTYTLNASKLLTYRSFFYLRSSTDVGGNTLSLVAKAVSNDSTFLGLPYLQYAKTEFDLRYYKSFGGERQLVARLTPGIAHPYGNSKELPFEKNFYAGGSSGIRAWQARTLGPGNYNRDVLGSEEIRRNLTNLDQLGEIKIEGNLEYRFKLLNDFFGSKLKGATFTDFGNIWRIRESASNPGGEFQFNKFLNQIAIGAGAGLRFDVEYFVFRFDVGVKVKDPQFTGKDQWVIKNLFNNEFKTEYNNTHAPDRYRFVQYNFGIGMPF